MTNTKPAIIYLLKDRFQVYSPLLPQIVECRFTSDVIRDLDVVNNDQLERLVKAFIANAKFQPCNLFFVMADNTYFTKDFSTQDPAKQAAQPTAVSTDVSKELMEKQINQFIEHVPYDNVVSKSFPQKVGVKVIATNKDFYESIVKVFELQNFTVSTVLPGLAYGNGLSAKPVLDSGTANIFLQRAASLKQYDLLSQAAFTPVLEKDTEEIDEVEAAKSNDPQKPNKKRLIALSGVFASLVVVLIIVAVQTFSPPSPPQQPIQADSVDTSAPPPPATQTNTQPDQPVQADEESNASELSVLIINASGVNSGIQVREQLVSYNFKSISIENQESLNATQTQVTFSDKVNNAARNSILEELRAFSPSLSVQNSPGAPTDVRIILSQ